MAGGQGADAGTVTRGGRVRDACRALAPASAATWSCMACGEEGDGGGGGLKARRAEARGKEEGAWGKA